MRQGLLIGITAIVLMVLFVHMRTPSPKNMASIQDTLFNDPVSPSIGNPYGAHVTVTEFFDYHCGPCKDLSHTLEQLVAEDTHVRVVFKECPRLSENSVLEAQVALAVYSIDPTKYVAFHNALMASSDSPDIEGLVKKAEQLGVNSDQLKTAMKNPDLAEEINRNNWLMDQLNSAAIPTIVIGEEVVVGDYNLESIKAMVAKAREAAKASEPSQ